MPSILSICDCTSVYVFLCSFVKFCFNKNVCYYYLNCFICFGALFMAQNVCYYYLNCFICFGALFMAHPVYSLNLVVVDSAKSFTEAMLFFCDDAIVCTLFIFHAMLDHSKKECAAITQIVICNLLGEPHPPHLTFAILFG